MNSNNLENSERSQNVQNLKQLKGTEVKELREKILENQGFKCAICGKTLSEDDAGISLDHQHRLNKNQALGTDGAGLIRGVLCRDCNVYEGKIWNNGTRYKQFKTVKERIEFLKQLIQYYEAGTYPFIHPTEKVPEKSISKRQYNKLKKVCPKVPEYPKSTHLTKRLKELFDKYKINPFLV